MPKWNTFSSDFLATVDQPVLIIPLATHESKPWLLLLCEHLSEGIHANIHPSTILLESAPPSFLNAVTARAEHEFIKSVKVVANTRKLQTDRISKNGIGDEIAKVWFVSNCLGNVEKETKQGFQDNEPYVLLL